LFRCSVDDRGLALIVHHDELLAGPPTERVLGTGVRATSDRVSDIGRGIGKSSRVGADAEEEEQ
jgi:hypothetical protein